VSSCRVESCSLRNTFETQNPGRIASRPERHPREENGTGDGHQPEAHQRPWSITTLTQRRGRDRVLIALVWNDERGGDVDQDAGPADQGEHDEADAIERGVDVEVTREAPADPREHPVGAAALEALDHLPVDCVFIHCTSVDENGRTSHPE
jgi:hypothetical protein